MADWWRTFFDADYVRLWGASAPPERSREQADGLWQLLRLSAGARVLDAPCGYGRLSLLLAERGANVLGVDQSEALLAEAERGRGQVGEERLRYLCHDLREPVDEAGFDSAINIFSSLGYGSEEDDLAILRTLTAAVRPGGQVFVDTMHRDAAVAGLSQGRAASKRLADGTLFVEEPVFDAVSGRMNTCWYWSGPSGSGAKPASFRLYCITELVRLIERAGLRFVSAHQGCSPEPFVSSGPSMGGRVGLLAARV